MDFTEFQNYTGSWGFLCIPVRNETIAVRSSKDVAAELLKQFRVEAEQQGATLVRGSMHQYNESDKTAFGIEQQDGYTNFLIYVTK